MNPDVLTTVITAGAAVLTAIVALVVNYRGFAMLDNRISDSNRRIDDTNRRIDDLRADTNHHFDETNHRFDETNRRIDTLQGDLKEFFRAQVEYDKRLGRIEDKLGIPPR
jgi:predicted  nucleic acid-binding Zn-ribbon protein